MNIQPHGGKLINRRADPEKASELLSNIDFEYEIDLETTKDLVNIADGVYSPLEGFLNHDDFVSVVEKKILANGTVWTIPIYFHIPKKLGEHFRLGSNILLKNQDLEAEFVLHVEDKFEYERVKFNENVFGTNSTEHPGVNIGFSDDDFLIGGEIWLIKEGKRLHPEYNLTPAQTRKIFKTNNWKSIVGFQTRNPAHLSHEFIQKLAMEFVDGLFINPIIGKKKPGDFKDEVILEVYKFLTQNFYPENSTFLSIFPSKMNYAGPREAVFHALVRQNYGCTHFIVGRDHAGVGDFYDHLAAHRIFDELEGIDINVMKFSHAFYSHKSRMFTTAKVCPFDEPDDRIAPSGTLVRQLIKEKRVDELEQFMRKEVIDIILNFEEPFV
jgi:sulfate adenylyltransferase